MPATVKRRTNITLDAALVEDARTFGLNVSAVAQSALAQAVREAKAAVWREDNAEAIRLREAWYAEHGLPLAAYVDPASPLAPLMTPEAWRD